MIEPGKILTVREFLPIRQDLRKAGMKLVFTNGVFDILHKGHAEYLLKARNLGDALVIGLNSDSSVRRIKGEKRPINPEADRAYLLASLKCVDFVVYFTEDTPFELISEIIPDYLVKGADYRIDQVIGRDVVEENGGQVLTVELTPEKSTTNVIEKVLNVYGSK
ncbi:MAG: D-glycero-beta-D-manno-heptose 1-phosphate adenylyltransferase [Bacteroidetes bacterium]|nr:D-glycero-beta-D-manno-heptose 1-phosphate adenylyltransferase [Bacteroidota bacterium]